jgi:hypothetical protein
MKENKLIDKGFDITTKATAKKYPFIKGWKYGDDYQKYTSITVIDLYIDFYMLSDYLNIPLQPYWKIRLKDPENDYNSSYAIGGFLEELSPTQDDDMHKFRTKISDHYKNTYSYIPDELKRTYTLKSEHNNPDRIYPAQPSVHNFIVYNE